MKRAILIITILFLSLNSFSQRKFYKELNETIPATVYSDTLPANFVLITDLTELKGLYIKLYKGREADGLDYFESFRADLVIKYIAGIYTAPEVFELEVHIKLVQDELILGNYMTAQSINSNLTLSGIYDQEMKDEISLYIGNYLSNNY